MSEDAPLVNMHIPFQVTADVLAVALAHSTNSNEELVAIVKGIDEESQDWGFALELADWLLGTLGEYADEVDNAMLGDALDVVRDQLRRSQSA